MRLKLVALVAVAIVAPEVDRVDEAQMRLKLSLSTSQRKAIFVDRVDEAQMRLKQFFLS